MSDLVKIVLKDQLHIGKMGLTDSAPISQIELENSAGGRIVVNASDANVVVAPNFDEAIVALNAMLRGPAGPEGPPGQPAQAVYFVQPNAESEWVIPHGLNSYPAVTVVDTAGDHILADLHFPDKNVTVVRFSNPLAGVAYLR